MTTWQQLNEQEQQYRLQLKDAKKKKQLFETLERQYQHAQQDAEKLVVQIRQHEEDLTRLDSVSFRNWLRQWSGKLDGLKKQQEDRLAVLDIHRRQLMMSIQQFEEELTELVVALDELDIEAIEARLTLVKLQKKMYIEQHKPAIYEKLMQYEEAESYYKQMQKELREAIRAGEKALQALVDVAQHLGKTKDYSAVDMLTSGSLVATYLKYDAIDEANLYIVNAQQRIQQFYNELQDVAELETTSFQIEPDGLIRFADYFFDDIFSALTIHQTIKNSAGKVIQAKQDIIQTLQKLTEKQGEVNDQLQDIAAKEQQLLHSNM